MIARKEIYVLEHGRSLVVTVEQIPRKGGFCKPVQRNH
jgi:hypothetical protein